MPPALPAPVSALFSAPDDAARDAAWSAFLKEYSKLLLRAAQRTAADQDEAMEHYVFILERLRENGFRRLQHYSANGRGKFSTWLMVVARRLCVDNHRRMHGRPQSSRERDARLAAEDAARRNLAILVAGHLDPDLVQGDPGQAPDAQVIAAELRGALAAALRDLPLKDQLLLTLRFHDGHSPERIAAMLHLPTRFHVYRQLKAVLAHLRTTLEKRGITEP